MERQISSVKNSKVSLTIILELFDHLTLLFVCLINWGFIARECTVIIIHLPGWLSALGTALLYYSLIRLENPQGQLIQPARHETELEALIYSDPDRMH